MTIDVPSCMALGATSAILERGRFRALGAMLFGFTPLAHLFELYFHDWEWQYLAPSLPPWTSMAFIIGMNGLGVLTYEVARKLEPRQRKLLLAAILGSVGLYCLIFFRRVLWVGTYAEWSAGTAPFMLSRMDFMLLLAGTGTYLAVSTYLWLFRRWNA